MLIKNSNGDMILAGTEFIEIDSTFIDDFERPDGAGLYGHWREAKQDAPGSYDPFEILDGEVVVSDPLSRSDDEEDYVPFDEWDNYQAHPGKLIGGISCAYHDFERTFGRIKLDWTAHYDDGSSPRRHVECAPLCHVDPTSDLFAYGGWYSSFGGSIGILLVGSLTNPPEDFQANVTHTATFAHTGFGVNRTAEMRFTNTQATFWLDGVQLSLLTYPGAVNIGTTPVTIPAELQGSTKHGFSHDAHLVEPIEDIPLWSSISRFEYQALGMT